MRSVQQSNGVTDDRQGDEAKHGHDAPVSDYAADSELHSADMHYDDANEPELAAQADDSVAGEFEAESDFADAADNFSDAIDNDARLSAESVRVANNNSDWETENNPGAATSYRPSHTPAAERIKRLSAVDMADDLTEAVENYTAPPFGEASISSEMIPDEREFDDHQFETHEFETRKFETREFGDQEFGDHELDDDDYEDDREPEIIVFDDVDEEHMENRHMFSSPVAAALTRPSEAPQASQRRGAAQKPKHEHFADRNVGDGNIDEEHENPDMPRMPDTPKWSESARFHMSNMLAASRDNVTPGDLTSRIDTTPDRHRRSSAMMLLGLPALLMLGFSGAYLYHTDSMTDGNTVVANLQSTISATALSIVSDGTKPDSDKISESIIQKQEVESIEIVRTEPDLPPPIAPDLVEFAPLTPPSEPVSTKIADAEAPIEITPVEEAPAASAPALIQSIPNLPPLDPPRPVEAPVEIATPAEQPVVVAAAEPVAAAPVPVAPTEELPVEVTPVEEKREPTITPAGGGFLSKYFNPDDAESAEATATTSEPAQQIASAKPPQQVAALAVPPTFGVTPTESQQDATEVALPDAASSDTSSEDAQLISRGTQHLEIGDISAARLLFELAAQNGSAKASTAMGRSYDPVYFQQMGVRGVLPDAEKAVSWYEKAVNAGDEEATEHLQKLTVWMRQ